MSDYSKTTFTRKRKASPDSDSDVEHADHRYPAGPSSGATSAPTTTVSTMATSNPTSTTLELPPEPVPGPISTSSPENITPFATRAQNTTAELSRFELGPYPSTSTSHVDHSQAERNPIERIATDTPSPGITFVDDIDSLLPSDDDVQQAAELIDILNGDSENSDTGNPHFIVIGDDNDSDDEDEDNQPQNHSTQDIEDGDDSSGDSDATDRWRNWLRQRQQRYLDAQEHESAIVVEDEEHDHDQNEDQELALNAPGRRYVTTITGQSPSRPGSDTAEPVRRERRRRNRPHQNPEPPSSPFLRQLSSRSPDVVISDDDEDYEPAAAGTSAGHAAAAAAAAAATSTSSSSNHRHQHRRRRPSARLRFNAVDANQAASGDSIFGMSRMLREAMEAHERRRAEAAATRTAIPAFIPPARLLLAPISSIPPSSLPSIRDVPTFASAMTAPSTNTVTPPPLPTTRSAAGEATGTMPRITDRLRCSICLELPSAPTMTRCGHLFCRPCITQAQALGMGRKCPVCRTPLTANRLQNMIFETAAPAPTLVE